MTGSTTEPRRVRVERNIYRRPTGVLEVGFKDASGVLSFTETVVPVLADALHNPVFFAATGEFTGTVSGVTRQGREEQGQGEEQ